MKFSIKGGPILNMDWPFYLSGLAGRWKESPSFWNAEDATFHWIKKPDEFGNVSPVGEKEVSQHGQLINLRFFTEVERRVNELRVKMDVPLE